MRRSYKATSWACIISTLLMGCYSSTLIDLQEGDKKSEIYSGRIEYVIMKNGVKHEFDTPPTPTDSAIVFNLPVRIHLSDANQISSGDENGRLNMDRIQSVVRKDGELFQFAAPPKVVGNTIVGNAVNKPTTLPLTDVAAVSIEEFSYTKTVLLAVFVGVPLSLRFWSFATGKRFPF